VAEAHFVVVPRSPTEVRIVLMVDTDSSAGANLYADLTSRRLKRCIDNLLA